MATAYSKSNHLIILSNFGNLNIRGLNPETQPRLSQPPLIKIIFKQFKPLEPKGKRFESRNSPQAFAATAYSITLNHSNLWNLKVRGLNPENHKGFRSHRLSNHFQNNPNLWNLRVEGLNPENHQGLK